MYLSFNELNLHPNDYRSLLNSLYNIVKFEGEQEIEYDQKKIYNDQLSKLSKLSIQTDLLDSVCIVTDNTLSSLPFNLLQRNNSFIFLSNPIYSIPSNSFQLDVQQTTINQKISFWSPIKTEDIVLNKAFNSIETILNKFHSEINTGINIEKILDADIDIIIAHGGKSIDTKNTISAESSFSKNPQMYTYTNIEDAVENPKIILFFVCHSGKISKDYFFEKQNSILKNFFNKGAEVVIAPKWPLNIDILPIWLEVFLNELSLGNSSLKSFHLASKAVYNKFKNIGSWGCLHYFGNKDVYMKST